MLRALLLTSALALLSAASASAQAVPGAQESFPGGNAQQQQQQKSRDFGSPTDEMLRRAEIRHEEDLHKEMVERSDEAAQLAEQILSSFNKNSSLTSDDYKKLERLEKLVRKIRGGAGGSDDEEELNDPPGKVEAAVSRLAELSGALKKSVEKTSRLVISAGVIKNSNEVIELVRHIRTIKQP